jgi:mannose-6-phosphate isomerase-like protein (cupin superfamily)
MEEIYELEDIISRLDDEDRYFIDFLNAKGLKAGILRLHPGEKDTQEPHQVDEVYYVIEGRGFIEINGKNHTIKQGTSVFIPAKSKHRFHGNVQDLVVFYALASH